MINYFFDGSFDGLLTAIYEAYYRHETPDSILPCEYIQQAFWENNIHIQTDSDKASKVYAAVSRKISYNALTNIYHAYLSDHEKIHTFIYQYVKLGFKKGASVDLYLSDDRVLKVQKAAKRVRGECHAMLGLIRFKKLDDNLYYAPFNPSCNITVLVCPHFKERLSDQNWIIHDVNRNIAGVFDGEKCLFIDLPSEFQYTHRTDKDSYEILWKEYFNSICIKERIKPKLQKQHMPVKYWKYLTEKQNL
jgi:probable DNA metabolism protein